MPPIEEYRQVSRRHVYPVPLSFTWRLIHWLSFMNGGIMFLIGSFVLFPSLLSTANDTLSAWMYTIGSATFLFADILEWLMNNNVGCIFDDAYRDSYEDAVIEYLDAVNTWSGWYYRAENGVNFFLSACGSFLYLVGSICFLPQVDRDVIGYQLFVIASIIIIFAQTWKVHRTGRAFKTGYKGWQFAFSNYLNDIPGLCLDSFTAIGGLAYLEGSSIYLYEANSAFAAALWYTIGGLLAYTFAGFTMFYRYFFTSSFPNDFTSPAGECEDRLIF